MAETDPEIIKKTQDTLGKFIKRPPLTEKLLSRPPFRFLHDIATAVISSTGFMKGLFTDIEMNSDNVKEKEAKLIFLDKLIGMVSLVINKSLDVKASSIVAGKESDKTNILLQYLAKAISKKVDNAVYVKKVLDGEAKKLGSSKSATASKEKSSDKSKITEKPIDEPKVPDKNKVRRQSSTGENAAVAVEVSKSNQSSKSKKPKESTNEIEERKHRKLSQEKNEIEPTKEKEIKKSSKPHKSRNEKTENSQIEKTNETIEIKSTPTELTAETSKDENILNEDNDIESLKKLQRPSSAKGTRQRHENDHYILSENKDIENNSKKPMVRPPSARPAPPKLRKSSEANLDEAVNVITTQSKVSGLIVDAGHDSDEGDFIVEEFVGGGDIDVKFSHTTSANNAEEEDGVHGSLVQKIMQSKKDFRVSDEKTEAISHSDISRKRERQINEKEIEKIRQNLQMLTKSVNPLGKLIDFVQEDLDTMQKEADRWHIENEELDKKLLSEQNLTNKLVKPIKEKLLNEIKTISAQEEAIAKLKAKIEANSKKIETMLFNVCSSYS